MGARSTGSHPTTTKADGHLIEYFRQTFVEGGGGTNAALPSGLTATGGVVSEYTESGTVYRAHVFTSSGTFNVTALANGNLPNAVEYLVVAGGGGGGYSQGGGGGAGGLRTNLSGHPLAANNPSWTAAVQSYAVTIGAGGAGSVGSPNAGANGVNSVLAHPSTPITALAGGGGGSHDNVDALAGGSGGGAGRRDSSKTGGSGSYSGSPSNPQPYRQGYDGGDSSPPYATPYCGAGGGGAGGAGSDASGSGVGTGGAGVQVLIVGPPTTTGVGATGPSSEYGQWFAGGGGGGSNVPQTDVPAGGGGAPPGNSLAGGGIGGGGTIPNAQGGDALANTGAGGGGGSHPVSEYPGGDGGSGIVVVRYKIAEVETAKATGGAISFYGGKTIHTFTHSGEFATTSDWTSANVEYLVVGGGGAGGEHEFRGGGGGAGAYKTGTTPIGSHPVSTIIQIGAGGAPIGAITPSSVGNGTPSYFGTPITSPGGGMGGTYEPGSGSPGIEGGSGGGAGGLADSNAGNGTGDPFPGTIGATPPNGWGNNGGAGSDNPIGAGGGGAGGVGQNSGPTDQPLRGLGGPGVQVPTTFRNPKSSPGTPGAPGGGLGTPGPNGGFYLAGGGNAGGYSTAANPLVASTRPAGGGGFGGNAASPYAGGEAAIANTGGGGGGASGDYNGGTSGKGASGIVLIAYPT